MGSFSIFHWLIVLAIVLVLFGNRLPNVGKDLGSAIRGFKDGLKGDDEKADKPASGRVIDADNDKK